MNHLVRAGGLLLAVLIVGFVIPRVMPFPESFDEFGFYPVQSEEDTREWASRPLQYADPAICSDCHQDNYATWEKAEHSTVSCENCHGPALAHVEEGRIPVVDISRESCGTCHKEVIARPDKFPQIDIDTHGGQTTCVTCHSPHSPLTGLSTAADDDSPKAGFPWISHALEGRSDCLLCHDTSGMKPFPEDHNGRGQDTCLNCHRSE